MNTEMPGGGMPPEEPPQGQPAVPPGQGMPGAPMPGAPMPGAPMPGAPGGGMGGMPGTGMPGGPGGMPVQDKASGMAIASLILSLSGLLCGITAIIGVILGLIELSRIKKGQSSPKGKSLAKAGVIIGIVLIAVGLLVTIISIATGGFSFEFNTQT